MLTQGEARFAQTLLGPVSVDRLGIVDCHEHLFIRGGMPVQHFPDFRLDEFQRIAHDVAEFRAAGGTTIVEMSPIDWGRDVRQMIRLAKEFDLHIIAATGFHKSFYYSDIHWMYEYHEDDLVALVCAELLEGMDVHNYSGPLVSRTPSKAGVFKVGTQRGAFTALEEKLMNVVARSHLATGARIVTHTDEGELALDQVEYLGACGVPADRIALSHVDRRLDVNYHKDLASTGAFLEYDAFARVREGRDRATAGLVCDMVEAGHVGSLLLGGDLARQGYWRGYGGAPGLGFVVDGFRVALRERGIPEEDLDAIYTRNPRRLLGWSAPASG
jgi:predicted metal-dependent phosphotriesterase family hydrolase